MEEPTRKSSGLMATPKLMLDGLSDFMKKRRTPSMRSKKSRDADERKTSAPAGLSQVLPVVGIISSPGTSKEVKVFPEYDKIGSRSSLREIKKPQKAVAPFEPMSRTAYATLPANFGRNLLNKKEAGPPSTIKESSESSQTIDDNDSEKGSGQLKHENTVVRADGGVSSSAKTISNSTSTAVHPALKNEIVRITQHLLDCIANRDFAAYARLCDPTVTLIGPETGNQIVEGVEFHRYQFEQQSVNNSTGSTSSNRVQSTLLQPHVHTIGDDGASIAYIVLTQYTDKDGQPRTRQSQESRVWQKKNGRWACIHAHRSGGAEAL